MTQKLSIYTMNPRFTAGTQYAESRISICITQYRTVKQHISKIKTLKLSTPYK